MQKDYVFIRHEDSYQIGYLIDGRYRFMLSAPKTWYEIDAQYGKCATFLTYDELRAMLEKK